MGPFSRLDDRQIEDLFAGKAPADPDSFAVIARLISGARSQLVRPLDPQVRNRHVAAMVEQSRSTDKPAAGTVTGVPTWRRVMERTKVAAIRIGAAVVATSLSTMGLAYAGVDLPGQAAENAFDAIGIQLPNQDGETSSGKSVSDDVRQVIEGSEERGCEFGQAVSEAASQNRKSDVEPDNDPCAKETADDEGTSTSGNASSNGDEGKARAEERSKGKAKANEAPRGSDRSAAGKAKAEERSNGKSKANEKPPTDPGNGGASGGAGGAGKGTGDEASSQGRERASEAKERVSSNEHAQSGKQD